MESQERLVRRLFECSSGGKRDMVVPLICVLGVFQ